MSAVAYARDGRRTSSIVELLPGRLLGARRRLVGRVRSPAWLFETREGRERKKRTRVYFSFLSGTLCRVLGAMCPRGVGRSCGGGGLLVEDLWWLLNSLPRPCAFFLTCVFFSYNLFRGAWSGWGASTTDPAAVLRSAAPFVGSPLRQETRRDVYLTKGVCKFPSVLMGKVEAAEGGGKGR